MNTLVHQFPPDNPAKPRHALLLVIGIAILAVVVFFVMLCEIASADFWLEGFSFAMISSVVFLVLLLLAYLLYFGILHSVFRRKQFSIAVRRRWFLGPPILVLIYGLIHVVNNASPTAAIQWILQGKPAKSIHSVHASHLTLLMSDRSIAWFKIVPEDLDNLIAQHQLTITNGVNFGELLSGDRVFGRIEFANRIPSFDDPICYARVGSDDAQHPYSVYLLTNPRHDEAVWYASYDR
jgi:hypothetical protein